MKFNILNTSTPTTIPIEGVILNFSIQEYNKFVKDYANFCKNIRNKFESLGKKFDLVSIHKEKFGKQTKTYNNGEFRFHVWERSNSFVYVNNRKGICFEVHDLYDRTPAFKNAKKAWNQYKKDMLK